MSERGGRTLAEVLAGIRERAKGMHGRPYVPPPEVMPKPMSSQPPPRPHQDADTDTEEG